MNKIQTKMQLALQASLCGDNLNVLEASSEFF